MKKNITFRYSKAVDFIGENEFKNIAPQISAAHKTLVDKTGAGSDFLGWTDLPLNYDKDERKNRKSGRENTQGFGCFGCYRNRRLLSRCKGSH